MTAPDKILHLVETFHNNLESYKRTTYNETQARQEFINPFFEALGWDMANVAGHAEAYKDVIHEDAIKVGGATKAPDYCFRIGGARKFFLEAKKPAVNIKDDVNPAFQLRRYAWSAKLALSVLTDFEEFAVYDCRVKPARTDPVAHSRIIYYQYTDYIDKWGEIENVFSKTAILKGSFDKYVESTKAKKGTAEVDAEFLSEIERWRDLLARNFALRNPALTQRELNFAVQQTIDRIIFLRICEDRGIETYGRLMALQNGTDVYQRLFELFKKADEKFNSGLFHFKKEKERENFDALTPGLAIDDKVLKDIFKNLYYPDSPYEFSVLPADILGQVYEKFLGKVIHLTAGHQAKIEEKPEVRKAGGVYYTPTYIVDYIVKNTVGKLLEGKKPGPKGAASKLKILDPACGSGSFLIGAYQYLLDWHRDQYIADGPEKWTTGKTPRLYQKHKGDRGEWRLTTDERKRILLNNIFGVDIDPQAVEVTKLSLLLKVLEGEDEQSIGKQMYLFQQRVLPDLSANIKCGNSLIAPDFYDISGSVAGSRARPISRANFAGMARSYGETGDAPLPEFNMKPYVGAGHAREIGHAREMGLIREIDDEEIFRINAFDWHAEFPDIMAAGGFDAVIGNPPYIFTRELITEAERQYYSKNYKSTYEKHNTFMLFMESMLWLLDKSGCGGFIVPNSWLTIESAHLLRNMIIPHLYNIADLNYTVFDGVSVEPCIFIISGSEPKDSILVLRANSKETFQLLHAVKIDRDRLISESKHRIVFSSDHDSMKIVDKVINASKSVNDFFDVRSGLQAYEEGKGNPPQTSLDVKNHIFDCDEWKDNNSFRYLQGRDIDRYQLSWSKMWLQYGPWLSQPREFDIFNRPRILLREITAGLPYCLKATYTSNTYLNNKSILNILHPTDDTDELKCLLGILNSRLISVYYKQRAVKSSRKIFPKVVIRNLREFPYPIISNNHKKIFTELISNMVDLLEKYAGSTLSHSKEVLKRQIDSLDTQIDRLVYQLYGLTDEEIRIVESGV